MRVLGIGVLSAIAALLAATVARAEPAGAVIPQGPAAFRACDGYGPATAAADGMTARNADLGADGDLHRDTPAFDNPSGLAACLLAVDQLKAWPQHWMRRVSLLRAEALHWLADGRPGKALEALDAADAAAAGKEDIWYRRSLGLGTAMVRAYALIAAGRAAEGDALAMQAWASRPYSDSVAVAALLVLGPNGPPEDILRVLKTAAPFAPQLAPFVAAGRLPEYPPAGAATVKALLAILPQAETADRRPLYAVTGVYRGMDGERWTGIRLGPPQGATQDVVARCDCAPAMLDDVVLLKAAELALAAGKPAFVVEAVRRNTLVSPGNGPMLQLGYQVDDQVSLLDPAGAQGRYLDARAVYDALAPLYPPAAEAR